MYSRRSAILLLAVLAPFAAAQRKSVPKPPEVEMLDGSAHREDGKVMLDGRVRNCGDKPIRGLTVLFDFVSAEGQVIATKNGRVDEEVLETGAESEFHVQVEDTARATALRVRFEDYDRRELRVAKAVTFPIE